MKANLRIGLAVLLVAPLLPACATAPWTCTRHTCVSIATEPLPAGVRGHWLGADGTALEVVDYYVGSLEEHEVLATAAGVRWSPAAAGTGDTQITSFDGRTVLAEQRLGEALDAPRRFHRLRLTDDRLDVAELRPEVLADAAGRDDVRLVATEFGEAVVYADRRAMAATLVSLQDEPEAWTAERMYLRAE